MLTHLIALWVLLATSWVSMVLSWDIIDRRHDNSSRGEAENNVLPERERKLNLIFPGTKWCGSGSNAESYNDLGSQGAADKCCRDHDNCPDIIEAGQSKHGLTNAGFYTKLDCACDFKFKKCLKGNTDKTSDAIGVVYFNVLNTQCFKKDHPIVKCAKYHPIAFRCSKYELDKSSQKLYQFFDVPLY